MHESFLSKAMDLYGDAVYRIALCRLQNLEDAQDVFQDTFLQLFQEKEAAHWGDERIKAWLLRVALNKCIDVGRRRKVHSYISLDDIPEFSGSNSLEYVELWDAVNRLPAKQRTIFHLHYSEGYKTDEIADILKTPPSTVRVYLNRARKQLRKELDNHENLPLL